MLLILATVAISMAIDSNGLFARARKAAEDWNKSVGDESTAIENAMLILNKIGSGSTSGGGTEPPVEEKVEVQSITLEPQTLELKEKETGSITATVSPTNATNKTVTWKSEEEGIATVQDNGNGTATVTGITAGATNIVATADGKEVKCSVSVTTPLISFTVDDQEYTCEEGMTWNQFIDSSYSKGNFYKFSDFPIASEPYDFGSYQSQDYSDWDSYLPARELVFVAPLPSTFGYEYNSDLGGDLYYFYATAITPSSNYTTPVKLDEQISSRC